MRVSCSLVLLGAFLLGLAELLVAEEDHLRRTLEKEILKHTITYLRTKLVRCLSQTPGSRTKVSRLQKTLELGLHCPPGESCLKRSKRNVNWTNRKVENGVDEMILYEVDMEVMQNTRNFLYSRTLQCMKTQKGGNQHRNFHNKSHNKVKVRDLFRPTPEPLPPSTQSSYMRRQSFILDGRTLNCESVTTRPDGSQLLCRNLLIDDKMRLPNWSLCPPRYDPDAWWQLNSIQSATFRVLDLEGLCQAMGTAAGIKGKVSNVKVAWDCDQTKPRLKWLEGKWAGEVKDNGFLRDINCEYNPVTT